VRTNRLLFRSWTSYSAVLSAPMYPVMIGSVGDPPLRRPVDVLDVHHGIGRTHGIPITGDFDDNVRSLSVCAFLVGEPPRLVLRLRLDQSVRKETPCSRDFRRPADVAHRLVAEGVVRADVDDLAAHEADLVPPDDIGLTDGRRAGREKEQRDDESRQDAGPSGCAGRLHGRLAAPTGRGWRPTGHTCEKTPSTAHHIIRNALSALLLRSVPMVARLRVVAQRLAAASSGEDDGKQVAEGDGAVGPVRGAGLANRKGCFTRA